MATEKPAVKLNNETLTKLPAEVAVPKYDRSAVQPNTVHIGVGGFHRAHQAVYLDDLLAMSDMPRWGECGIGVLQSDDRMRDAMKSQDCLYTLVVRSANEQSARVIGSMVDYIYAPGNREAAIEKMAAEETKIVSLTITEGGYFIDDATGAFLKDHADIQHDVQNPREPITSLGYILEALRRRIERGIKPFTVMSCDNLQGNGHVIERVLLEFAGMIDTKTQQWIAANVAFPNSMVDRITPTTKPQDIAALRERFGVDDAWPVVTEPFIQWVIEDRFCNGRPQWERFDSVTMVDDVAPYELMKMRLLNASHMAIAYLGALTGYPLVHEVMQDPLYTTFVERFMEECTPVVPKIPGVDLPLYKRTLVERFSNPTINDQVTRLCSEGSAKMPKWVIPSIAELLQQGRKTTLLSLVVAAWIHYLRAGVDELGKPLEIIDARAAELIAIAKTVKDDPMPMLSISNIYGPELPKNAAFVAEVREAMALIQQKGAKGAIQHYLATE
ncbi:MAG: mannitol dehydrogenase family protein [Acidobacteria bacterium]|nr:mannitol dehydrogenase family protein [Acidobacteriota bacterium]